MNTQQTNKLNMYKAVATVLEENRSKWVSLPIVEEIFKEFNALLDELRTLGAQQVKKTTGVTQSKAGKKDAMAKKAADLAASAYAYAIRQQKPELQSKFDYASSEIRSVDDNNAIHIAQSIVEEAEPLLAELAAFGVSAEEISELKMLIEDFADSIGEKSSVKSGRVSTTKSLNTLFKEVDTLLKKQLDKLLSRLAESQPEFYQTYKNARVILDLGTRSKKPKEGEVEG